MIDEKKYNDLSYIIVLFIIMLMIFFNFTPSDKLILIIIVLYVFHDKILKRWCIMSKTLYEWDKDQNPKRCKINNKLLKIKKGWSSLW